MAPLAQAQRSSTDPINIGSRRELIVDDYLVDSITGAASQRLHHPVRKEIALVHDAPWEGNAGNYHTIFYDPDQGEAGLYRMYYHAWHIPSDGNQGHPLYIAYAESQDGIKWVKPELGLVEHDGSTANNIVLATINDDECHDFSVFKDTNPHAPETERYKAVGYGRNPKGLYAFKSADGIRWSPYNDSKPIMTGHAFDTQNIAFWDPNIGKYRAYVRDFDKGRRDIMMATSDDFVQWSKREWLQYPTAPDEQLYTNQIMPYYRAEHLFVGFPARYVDRGWTKSMRALPSLELRQQRSKTSSRYGTAITDALFMTSRDGLTFRRWPEAFLRPGLRTQHNWAYGDNYVAWQVVETDSSEDDSPRELSLYATESYFTGKTSRLRRYAMRIDGFASVFAPLAGGELITKPLTFTGNTLNLNFATSAAGSIRVEIQDASGEPIQGFALADCDDIFGDEIEYPVRWRDNADVSSLIGQAVRLKFVLRDADLYALRFTPSLPRATAKLSAREALKVVCFGDSVTGVYYHTGGRRAYTSMVELGLRQAYPGAELSAINAGISGHTTVNGLARIQADVLDQQPDVVTVMFGLNDMVRVPLDQFAGNLKKIVEQCRGVGAEVLLCTPNAVIETSSRPSDKLVKYCDVIREVGRELDVAVCDCYEAYAAVRSRNHLAWRTLMSDEIHPNMDGHKLIATEIVRSITGQDVRLGTVGAPAPAVPKTLARLQAGEPLKVLAMPPYDSLIQPTLKQIESSLSAEVTTWPIADQDLAQIEAFAKTVRKMDVDLVILAVPRSADAPTTEAFVRSYSWIMNWSLSFGYQQWDVIAITPDVSDPKLTPKQSNRDQLVRRLIRAQDLSMIDRKAGDDTSAAELLAEWLIEQTKKQAEH